MNPRRRPRRGHVIYRGPSMLDGAPIVAIVTWRSENMKTGDVPQVWILREDIDPNTARHVGLDRSVCGDCELRGSVVAGRNKGRECYVLPFQAPRTIWGSYQRGRYKDATRADLAALFAGSFVRLGAYGDPAAVPWSVWEQVTARAIGWTGYTHAWRMGFALQEWCMASCETDEDEAAAKSLGYRTFRLVRGTQQLPGRVVCPGSAERDYLLTCRECQACNGGRGADIQIRAHGWGFDAEGKRRLAVI